MAETKQNPAPDAAGRREVTVKFGKGLLDNQFTAKSGKEMVKILIPNRDPSDHRSWEAFVLPAKMVHDNKYGKGVWVKLPEDGTTKLSRDVRTGTDEAGKPTWGKETRTVTNKELKSMMEAYKEKNRSSVLSGLSEKQGEAQEQAASRPKKAARRQETAL